MDINFLQISFSRVEDRMRRITPVGIVNRLKAAGLWGEIESLEDRARAVMRSADNARILELKIALGQWESKTFSSIRAVVESANKKGGRQHE